MVPPRPQCRLAGFIHPSGGMGLAALILLTAMSLRSAQNPAPLTNAPPPSAAVNNQAALATPKPKEGAPKSGRDKVKADAAELSTLADQLRDELNKLNVNVFSLDVLQKAEKIEKLAKQIKGEANGH